MIAHAHTHPHSIPSNTGLLAHRPFPQLHLVPCIYINIICLQNKQPSPTEISKKNTCLVYVNVYVFVDLFFFFISSAHSFSIYLNRPSCISFYFSLSKLFSRLAHRIKLSFCMAHSVQSNQICLICLVQSFFAVALPASFRCTSSCKAHRDWSNQIVLSNGSSCFNLFRLSFNQLLNVLQRQ